MHSTKYEGSTLKMRNKYTFMVVMGQYRCGVTTLRISKTFAVIFQITVFVWLP